MSLIAFTGFEQGALPPDFGSVSNVTFVTTGTPRTGSFHCRTFDTNSGLTYLLPVADQHATMTLGAARITVAGNDLFRFYGDANLTVHITVHVYADRSIGIFRGTNGGTMIGSCPPVDIIFGTYQYWELKVLLSDTVGTVQLRLNGTTVINLTGVDTKNAGTASVFSGWGIINSTSTDTYIDDVYVTNGAGSAPYDGFLGDCRVEGLRPNANGNSSQLVGSDGNSTDNYLLVDEVTPSDADYNGDVTDGDKDTYGLNDLLSTNVTVYGVKTSIRAAKSDAGAKSGRIVLRTNSTDYGGTDLILGTSYARYGAYWILNPNTGVAFTAAEINALESGFEVRT